MSQPDPTVLSLHLGKARDIESADGGEWWDKDWRTGFYKTAVDQPSWLGYEGFRGDEQADRRFHGGPEKAVCVYSAAHYEYWRGHLGIPDLPYGAFGENLTIGLLTEPDLSIGDIFMLGEARVQVSQPRQPCWKLARRWRVKDLAAQVERNGFSGWYFRVLHHGWVRAGDRLHLEERPFPEWTIQRCNEIMHHLAGGREAAAALASCPLLSSSWKDSLWAWAQRPEVVQSSRAARTAQPS